MVKIKIRSTKGKGILENFVDSTAKAFKAITKYVWSKVTADPDFGFKFEQARQELINSKKIAFKITNHKKHILKVRVN